MGYIIKIVNLESKGIPYRSVIIRHHIISAVDCRSNLSTLPLECITFNNFTVVIKESAPD